MKYIRYQYPDLLAFHPANGGYRNAREGTRFKAMGVLKGVSDILILHNGKLLAIELKIAPNKPTLDQIDFINRLQNQGHEAHVVYDFDKAKEIIDIFVR